MNSWGDTVLDQVKRRQAFQAAHPEVTVRCADPWHWTATGRDAGGRAVVITANDLESLIDQAETAFSKSS